MNDEQMDWLVRGLDVASEPDPSFVEESFRVLSVIAREESARDRTWLGRLTRRPRLVPWPAAGRTMAIAVLVALLSVAVAWTLLGVGTLRSDPLSWPAGHIMFGRENRSAGAYDVFVVAADGSREHLLFAAPRELTRISPDGRWIASAIVDGERVYPAISRVGDTTPRIVRPDPTLNLGAMAWSRDDQWLALEGWDNTQPDRSGIYLLRADGTGLRRLTGSGVPGAFSPDDRSIVLARAEGMFVVGVDGTGEHQIGTLKPDQSVGYMPDGRSVYATADGSLWIVDIATGSSRQIGVPGGRATSARLAPDGSAFVLTVDAAEATTPGIWMIQADGTQPRLLVDAPTLGEVWPDWLP
jgi:Tol biopolymer transport system component